mgnify:CR=1 FL=1
MKNLTAGILAGLIATAVLSVLMMLKGMMGMMPDLNVIAMIAGMMGVGAMVGWVVHFVIGAVYGAIFAQVLDTPETGTAALRGIALGVIAWLVMMIVIMPMTGNGLFGMAMPSGMMIPVATLVLHIIFGAVLGLSYVAVRNKGAGA